MKKLLLGMAAMWIGGSLSAQMLSQWFAQNKTQLREMGEQIAALELLAGTLEDGTQAIGGRLDTLATTQQGDLELHVGYFDSLKQVNPAVSSDPRVAAIRMYSRQVRVIAEAIAADGQGFATAVGGNLRTACQEDQELLNELVSDGTLRMEDAERLELIGEIEWHLRRIYVLGLELLAELESLKKQNR